MKTAAVFLAVLAGAFCSFADEIEIKGGGSARTTDERFFAPSLAPCRIAFEARRDGKGGTLGVGFPGVNVECPLSDDWKRTSLIVAAPVSAPSGLPLRFAPWEVSGRVLVRDWCVEPLRQLNAREGELELGEGELLAGNRYLFSHRPGGATRNWSRPLASCRGVDFNTDRYAFWRQGGSIEWRFGLPAYRFESGRVSLKTLYSKTGEVCVSASTNGTDWVTLGSLAPERGAGADFDVPAMLLPAVGICIRLTCAKPGVQVSSFVFCSDVMGEPRFAVGSTRHVAAEGTEEGERPPMSVPDYFRTDYGDLLPGSTPDLAIWQASSGWKVPQCRAAPSAKRDEFSIALAANETEAAQLVLTPSVTLSNVTVSVEVPSLAVEVLRVAYVPVSEPVDATSVAADYPDPLPPLAAPLTLRAGRSQPLWIRVKAPKGTRGGIYRGRATVRGSRPDGSAFSNEVTVSVRVFGFELPDTMTCRTLFGFSPGAVARYHGLKSREDKLRAYDAYYRQLSDYHMSPYGNATYGLKGWAVKWNGDEPVFDWGEWDAGVARGFGEYHFNAMALMFGLGLARCDAERSCPGEIDGVKEGDPRYETRLKKLLGGVESHLAEKGWLDHAYVYCYDEPPLKFVPIVTNGLSRLAANAPGLRRFLVSPCREPLIGLVQTWCPMASQLESDLARERQRAGDDFWLYVCTQPRAPYATEFIDHPGVELRTWLWQCWAENVRGILVWHSNLWTEKAAYPDPVRPQNPYADPQVWSYTAKPYGNGDGRFIYPPESVFADIGDRASPLNAGPNFDKPVGSIRGEMIRDGIEDYEYLAILHRLDPKNQLLKVPGDISKSLRDFSKSPAGIEKRRIRLAEEIERKVASAKGAN